MNPAFPAPEILAISVFAGLATQQDPKGSGNTGHVLVPLAERLRYAGPDLFPAPVHIDRGLVVSDLHGHNEYAKRTRRRRCCVMITDVGQLTRGEAIAAHRGPALRIKGTTELTGRVEHSPAQRLAQLATVPLGRSGVSRDSVDHCASA